MLLHDIGKIGIPDAILLKPGPLTPAEWKIMRRHPEIGRQLVEKIPFLSGAVPIVYHHHERWDGTGYPLGLRGEAIPLGARIFAVADAFDAMTFDRPYSRAISFEAARAEIERCAGTHFDPAVVATFVTIPLETFASIRHGSLLDRSAADARGRGRARRPRRLQADPGGSRASLRGSRRVSAPRRPRGDRGPPIAGRRPEPPGGRDTGPGARGRRCHPRPRPR